MAAAKEYPGYARTGDRETVDFPFNGARTKQIRHKHPADEGTLVHTLYWTDTGPGHPRVYLDVAFRFGGPNSNVRINPGRPDYSERIIGRDGDRGR